MYAFKNETHKTLSELTDLSLSLYNRRPGTEITMTRRPRAPEERRGLPAADTHRTVATTAANRVRGRCLHVFLINQVEEKRGRTGREGGGGLGLHEDMKR